MQKLSLKSTALCRIDCLCLITENKEDTAYEFKDFLQKYEENICPVNGDIVYMHGSVRCLLHFEDETNENNDDEDDESVPFL